MKNYFDDIKDLYNKVSSLLIKIKETHPNLYQDIESVCHAVHMCARVRGVNPRTTL
jgi:hypothetical protein